MIYWRRGNSCRNFAPPAAGPDPASGLDIFGQIGRPLKAAGPALGGLVPARVLALGDSQSAVHLTSYINAVHPLSPAFDGFFAHSRGAGAAPLSSAGIDPAAVTVGVRIRAELLAKATAFPFPAPSHL